MKKLFLLLMVLSSVGCAVVEPIYPYDFMYYNSERVGKVIDIQPITKSEYVQQAQPQLPRCHFNQYFRFQDVCFHHVRDQSYGRVVYITGYQVRIKSAGFIHSVRMDYAPRLGSHVRF